MAFDRLQPYNDLPLLPPPVDLETKAVLKQVIAARTALAELKGAAQLLPNQGVLIQKDNQWFFEYYESEKLVSEKVAVKF